jgi:hypothetical protein
VQLPITEKANTVPFALNVAHVFLVKDDDK